MARRMCNKCLTRRLRRLPEAMRPSCSRCNSTGVMDRTTKAEKRRRRLARKAKE